MFNDDNTNGASPADIALMNAALALIIQRNDGAIAESNAMDIVTNNWQDGVNTVESLAAR